MQPVSVVIICKNEASVLAATLRSLQGVTDDIVLYDNGSTDDTIAIANQFDVNVQRGAWEGFGKTKNKANDQAKYEWILSLDADERVDEDLKKSILAFEPPSNDIVYSIGFKNYLGDTLLEYGEWGHDSHIRLFNRRIVRWNDEAVHETLTFPVGYGTGKLKGYIHHRTMADLYEYAQKTVHYAMLSADKYYRQGKKASWFKIRLSPAFNFLNYYIIKLGFLDGQAGYTCAKMTAHYTFLKYARLRELHRQAGNTKGRNPR
ncbi:MAG: glycosyltransferase family 2 protein [Chitinophagaceae bacterium]|nr:glycosyltransferase family 2 protein [Chitinophagaceae bacterium]